MCVCVCVCVCVCYQPHILYVHFVFSFHIIRSTAITSDPSIYSFIFCLHYFYFLFFFFSITRL